MKKMQFAKLSIAWNNHSVWARERCRISPPCLLAKCCVKRLC